MDNELKFFLEQGGHTVKELARLTGKSTSTIYKSIKGIDGVIEAEGTNGKVFSLVPEPAQGVARDTAAVESKPSPNAAVPAALPNPNKRGRKSTAAGSKLFPAVAGEMLTPDVMTVYENPRRKDSHGYRSLQIIIDNPGITTEDYLAKGGRLNDLRWDIAHGNVKAEG